MQLRQKKDALSSLGVQVVVVAPEKAEGLAILHKALKLAFPVVGDPEHTVFATYGLLRGNLPAGGDFVIDGEGIIRFANRGLTSDDRPELEELLAVVQAMKW